MVIEEVSAIQEDLEIERLCRESAEALASKVHIIFNEMKRVALLLSCWHTSNKHAKSRNMF